MSLSNFNDNINLAAPKALDQRTGKFVAGVWLPYDTVIEANTSILPPYRAKGLTVLISIDGVATEYWYRDGIADADLIPKGIATSGTVFTEDTPSLVMSGDGSVGSPLSGDVQLSKLANNSIKLLSDGLFVPQTIKQGVVYGGVVTWLSDYSYNISAAGYYINGVFYTSPSTDITLSAPDGALNRIDTFIVDDTGVASVLEGTPSTDPAQAPLDPATQLELSIALVETGTTEPTIEQECIYINDAEWTSLSSSVRINKASTSTPCSGTKCVEGTAPVAGDNIKFTRGTTFNPLTSHTILKFSLRSKGAFGGSGNNKRKLIFQFRNGVTNVGGAVNILNGSYGFDDTNITDCQNIAIPLIDFALPAVPVIDNLLITIGGTGSILGFRLDDMCFQGVPLPVPAPAVGIINITYANLVLSINNNKLIAGQKYRIVDFATKHYITDSNFIQYLDTIVTGVTEPLIVTAATTNSIYTEAKSELHPEDIIHYDWNPANWVQDISFASPLNWDVWPADGAIIAGFKGVIIFRHDTLLDNSMGYDFRNCKFRRWKQAVPAWDNSTSYAIASKVSHNGFIWVSYIAANLNNEPSLLITDQKWCQIIDLSLTNYWCTRPDDSSFPADALDFIDVKTFAEGAGDATYAKRVKNNSFGLYKDPFSEAVVNGTILLNNVFYLVEDTGGYPQIAGNTLGRNCYGNTVGKFFRNNKIGHYFNKNRLSNFSGVSVGDGFASNNLRQVQGTVTIGDNCSGNNLGVLAYCMVGSLFNSNIIGQFQQSTTLAYFGGNTAINIGFSTFLSNVVANRFKTIALCTFGNNCEFTTIGLGCNLNTFEQMIEGCTIGDNFNNNIVHSHLSGQNLLTATLIYDLDGGSGFNKEILKGKSPTGYMVRYIDTTGTQQIVPILT